MTSILLIRHGETAWNAERRLQGHTDIALSEHGQRQARALADALAAEGLDLVVSSDLRRARDTAQAVASKLGIEVQVDPRLRERCYGAFEGMLYSQVARTYPAEWEAWQARDIDALPPAGEREAESFRQFYQRAHGAVLDWAARHPGQRIALVSHGGVLECAYRAAHDMVLESPRTFPIKNASINRFHLEDGRLKLASWGEVEHLSQAAMDELA